MREKDHSLIQKEAKSLGFYMVQVDQDRAMTNLLNVPTPVRVDVQHEKISSEDHEESTKDTKQTKQTTSRVSLIQATCVPS